MPVRRLGCAGTAIALAVATWAPPLAGQGRTYEQLQAFSSLLNAIRLNYVDSVAYPDLVEAAIDGVLRSLDPHSRFVRRAEAERELAYQSGTLAGSGILVDVVDDRLVVLTVLPRSPGARAGVAAGDRLLSINDSSTAGLTPSEAGGRLIGEKGDKVRLLLERGSRLSPDTLSVRVKLDVAPPVSVSTVGMRDETTGYVRVEQFMPETGKDLERAVKALKGRGMKRLVLDFRGNPGGTLLSAVDAAALFLPQGTLVLRTEGRLASARQQFSTSRDGPFRDLPLMVLIDEGTASAAEAVAGCLQDHDRALILGRRSFGKALMQQVMLIPPQGDGVWLTIGRVVTPSGRVIQRSYRGLKLAQYYGAAGQAPSPADTLGVFYTARRREVRGGGGIRPDLLLPRPVALPGWWGVAADSGWLEAVADSVAALLPKDAPAKARWLDAREEWTVQLVEPLLARVRQRLAIASPADSAQSARLGRHLAHRATEVRWGPEAADEFLVRNDPDIERAMEHWHALDQLLRGPD